MHLQPSNERLLELLANHLVRNDYDLKKLIRFIATSHAYQAVGVETAEADSPPKRWTGPLPKQMTAEQFVDGVWLICDAAPTKFDAEVLRRDPSSVDLIESTETAVESHGVWVWGDSAADGGSPPAGETITMRHQFKLDGNVSAGVAVVTADNEFDLYINNRLIAHSADWTQPIITTVTGKLKKGDNSIHIIAKNHGESPNLAGMYFDSRIQLTDGKEVRVASGDGWEFSAKAAVKHPEGRLSSKPGPWKPVVTVDQASVYESRIGSQLKAAVQTINGAPSKMVRASLTKNDFLMRTLGRPGREQIVSSRSNEMTTLEAIELSNGSPLASLIATGAQTLGAEFADAEDPTIALTHGVFRRTLSREPAADEFTVVKGLFQSVVDQAGADAGSAVPPELTRKAVEDLLWAIFMKPEFWVIR